mmetsp:Transcript_33529/g.84407  ORF Transcript_33529/g.84407 Transcript_33529/m.84407 type:complete len:122 (+) Transcript_33529:3542-3907(+)
MGDHVLRRFVDEQVVRHGRADVLRWMWLELDWQRWAHFAIPAGPSFASRDAVTAAASKWVLGSVELRLFRDVFDEADRQLEIKIRGSPRPRPTTFPAPCWRAAAWRRPARRWKRWRRARPG